MRKFAVLAAALFVALSAGTDSTARSGRENDDHERARRAFQRGEVQPIVRILALAAQHLPGDVIEVKLDSRRGRLTYEIRVLTAAGRVRELVLDARTGDFVAIED